MKPMDPTYLLFTDLLDRVLAGDVLSPEDEATYASLLADNPSMREEAEMLMALGDLDAPPSAASRRLADAALQAFGRGEGDKQTPVVRIGFRIPLVLQASLAAAAGFVLWLQLGDVELPWRAFQTESRLANAALSKPVQASSRVELVYASGNARVLGAATQGQSSTSVEGGDVHGLLLSAGQRVEVGTGSACFVLDPGIDVCVGSDSRLRIDSVVGKERRLVLEQGRVSLQLAHQPRGFSVTVEAAGVDSTAVGTSYSVVLDKNATVQTTVLEGRVKVQRGSQVHMVDAHRRLELNKSRAQEIMLTRPQEAPEWAAMEAARLWQGHSPAVLHVAGQPDGAEVLLDGRVIGRSPLTSLVPAGHHQIAVRSGTVEHLAQDLTLLAGQRHNLAYQSVASKSASTASVFAPKAAAAPSKSSAASTIGRPVNMPIPIAGTIPPAEDLLSEARRLLVQGRYAQSALTYEALRQAYPNSPEARTVLVALAQLELEHHHNPMRAQNLLNQYLMGGPGPLTQEARHLRMLSLRAMGRYTEERSAIVEFLSAHPGSFQEATLRARLGELTPQVPDSQQP